ncbi:MAG TPA: hypothetical protein PL196_07465 [Burkholderiaceae bacterium]|nr:hypothetical protein [Burkholderiaceae bacterium]
MSICNSNAALGKRVLSNVSNLSGSAIRKAALACGVGAATLLAMLPPASAQEGRSPIEGVWRVTRHGVNCATGQVMSTFPAIMEFMRGGTWTGYAVPPGATPALGSPDYGTWKRESGAGNYSFRLLSYSYDAAGVFSGSTEVSAKLTLADDAQGFAYDGTVQFFDAAGNPMFSVCGKAEATRFK